MKTSKFFLSTLVAAAAMTSTVFAATESIIQINFNSNKGSLGMEAGWNDLGFTGNNVALKDSERNDVSATITFTGGDWGYADAKENVLKGYLDDSNISISVSGLSSYFAYDLKIIASSDQGNGTYAYKTINGVNYTGAAGLGVVGDKDWGQTKTGTVDNSNSFTILGLDGDLTLTSPNRVNQGTIRGCIAGLIIKTYSSTATNISLSGEAVTWAGSTIGASSWVNSAESAGTYADFSLTADTGVNVTGDSIVTDAIDVSGTGTLTLSGKAISLIGPGLLRAKESAALVVNNVLNFANGGTISGSVSFGDSAKINVNGGTVTFTEALSSGKVSAPTVSLSGGSSVSFTSINAGTHVDLSKLSGEESSRLKLTVSQDFSEDGLSSITALGADFKGSVEVAGGCLKFDTTDLISTLGSVKSVVLSGSSELVFVRGKNLEFGKDIVAEGSGGSLRSYNDLANSVKFSGKVSGTQISHVDGGTHTFTGEVDLDVFNAKAGATNFSGETKISTLNISGGTLNVGDGGVLTVNDGRTLEGGLAVTGTINVKGGGTAKFAGHDLMGWSGRSDVIAALAGDSTDKKATLYLNDMLTLTFTSVVQMNGNALVSTEKSSKINTFGGKFVATGKNNEISNVTIQIREAFEVEVTDETDVLSISSLIENHDEGSGGFTKVGNGTLALSGANTFTRALNVSAGTLVAESTSALGKGAVSVASGATLVFKTTVEAGTVSLAGGAKFALDLSGFTRSASDEDSLAWDILSAALSFNETGAGTLTSAQIESYFDADNSELGTYEEYLRTWSYADNKLTLTLAIPEPSAFGLLAGLGALALVGTRRRRRK